MFFDHKTKRFSGVLSEISKEKHDGLERLEARGELISTVHPSEEEIRLRRRKRRRGGMARTYPKLL